MSLHYKIGVFAGAAIGLGWEVAERYGAAGIIGSMLAGWLYGVLMAFMKKWLDPNPNTRK